MGNVVLWTQRGNVYTAEAHGCQLVVQWYPESPDRYGEPERWEWHAALGTAVGRGGDTHAALDDCDGRERSHSAAIEAARVLSERSGLDALRASRSRFVAALRALVATLPKCDEEDCDQPATAAWGRGGSRRCDVHAGDRPDYPRAPALRDALALLIEEDAT